MYAAVDSTTGKVYCTLYREDSVAVIDGSGDSLLYKRWCGDNPIGVACAPTSTGSKVYVAVQRGAEHLPVYDTRNDSLIGFVATPGTPEFLLPGERNGVVYCMQFSVGVAAIDVERDTVIAYNGTVPGMSLTSNTCFASDINKLYSAGDEDTMFVLDGKTLATLCRVGHYNTIGGAKLAYSAFGRKLYCAFGFWNRVTVVDVTTDTVVADISMGGYPYGPQLDGQGRNLYIGRMDDTIVSVVDVAGDTVFADFQLPVPPGCAACSPASHRVYYGAYSLAVFSDTAAGLTEEPAAGTAEAKRGQATLVTADVILTCTEATDVLDATGRLALVLPVGESRLAGLAAGVYYLRGRHSGEARRLVLMP
jgi:YVTN family beta-propeller protein